jgi:imidazolonepropionase-like amidohydrolase
MAARLPRLLALVVALAWAHTVATAASGELVAFVGATVIDGTGAPPLARGTVVVEGGRVRAVGPAPTVPVPEGAAVVELAGKWLVPGYIDAHVHFFQSGGLYTRPDVIDLRPVVPYERETAALRARLDETLARTFAAGITGVVDMGGPSWVLALRERAKSLAHAPRIAAAGPLIATWSPPELAAADPAIVLVGTPEEARAEVRRQQALSPDLIKIWFIRSPRGQHIATASRWIAAAIDEAHRLGLRVAVHASELETARRALALGADLLVHSVDDAPLDDDLLMLMRARGRGVLYIPTLGVYDGYWRVLGQDLGLGDLDRRYGDPRILDSLDDLSALTRELLPDWLTFGPAPPIEPNMLANLRRVHAAGITIAAGSDAGNIGTLPGAGFHRELALMAEAGLAPGDILRAATLGGAQVMGRAHELGSIEPGKRADFVILDADPLADIANAARIYRVVKDGVAYDPDAILAGLAGADFTGASSAKRCRTVMPDGSRAERRGPSFDTGFRYLFTDPG